MSHIRYTDKIFLLLLAICLLSPEVASTQEGSSFFLYQQPEYQRNCNEAYDQCSSDNSSGVYLVKPDGYPHPFEVYCNNDISPGGWTVIQRRTAPSLTFARSWEDYKKGFGFLSGEFWIGLNKLSYLTNQAVNELRLDVVLSNGSSFYINYNSFRISDEWSHYAVVSFGEFRSNWECVVSFCQPNMTRGSCACQSVCTDSVRQTDCYNGCVETCAPEGCLLTETNSYILNGESYITLDCSQNCTCVENHLICNPGYKCNSDATCKVKDQTRKCYCNDDYEGDGETCIRRSFTDCFQAYQAGHTTDGVYTIQPAGWTRPAFTVFCDMTTDGGGWTVFQRRVDGVTDFYRSWNEYKHGFGSRDAGNDFWLGNEQIYYLTNQREYKLRVDIVTSGGSHKYQEYASFHIGDESTKYRLSYGSDSGTAENGLYYNIGGKFSTHDQDNDDCSYHDFAEVHRGGWWYTTAILTYYCRACFLGYGYSRCDYFQTRSGCYNVCTGSNLNGDYNGGNGRNIFWTNSWYCYLRSAEMKIRPSSV